ncbi:MAG: hypothetical protein ACU83N_15155 [Gammaproteobacteria bacterium]
MDVNVSLIRHGPDDVNLESDRPASLSASFTIRGNVKFVVLHMFETIMINKLSFCKDRHFENRAFFTWINAQVFLKRLDKTLAGIYVCEAGSRVRGFDRRTANTMCGLFVFATGVGN